jgi:hypothetical protein
MSLRLNGSVLGKRNVPTATLATGAWNLRAQSLYRRDNIWPRRDPDAVAFAATSGATDIDAISDFAKGVKRLGLWESMVCWPLRSTQNAGTGTTAYSLGGLGTFNGTLINGPTWGTDGILFDAASSTHITTTLDVAGLRQFTALVATEQRAQVGTGDGIVAAFGGSTTSQYFILRKIGTTAVSVFVRSGGSNRASGIPLALGGTPDWRVWGWGTIGGSTVLTNGGVATAGAIDFVPDESGSKTLDIGIQAAPSINPYDGKIAWVLFTKDAELSTAQQLSLYNLYKQTLGTGLGLP